jgi:glycosyltransferase involved in cell wall biosynthesis
MFEILTKIGVVRLFSRLFGWNINLCKRKDIALLKQHGVDIILFPKQFYREIEGFPFMTMNWDAGHKSTYAFPEFQDGMDVRENWYSLDMQRAMPIIVESNASREEFSVFFNIPTHKIEVVPLFPGGVVDMTVSGEEQRASLIKYGLLPHQFYYYPAQFWAHKNHYNLILAFRQFMLANPNSPVRLVLTGSDKGNKAYIKKIIADCGMEKHVSLLGFVSNEEVYSFYKNALALVMPTFLGPTNMPVLEAMALGTPVICSDLSGHRETCGDGAIYIEPTDTTAWADAMQKMLNEQVRYSYIAKANAVQSSSPFNIEDAIRRLELIFLKYIPIRKTFD